MGGDANAGAAQGEGGQLPYHPLPTVSHPPQYSPAATLHGPVGEPALTTACLSVAVALAAPSARPGREPRKQRHPVSVPSEAATYGRRPRLQAELKAEITERHDELGDIRRRIAALQGKEFKPERARVKKKVGRLLSLLCGRH